MTLLFQIAALVSAIFAAFSLMPTTKVIWGWLALALWFAPAVISQLLAMAKNASATPPAKTS